MNLAIIPARGGSRRIPGKNIREFHGKPIIAYSIEAAKRSGLFDMIVVTTEDEGIADVARTYGVSNIWRPDYLAVDGVGTREVVKFVVDVLEDGKLDSMEFIPPFQYVCCIYATSPMLATDDLKAGFMQLQNFGVDHAISIAYPPLRDAAQFYWSRKRALKNDVEYFGPTTVLVPIDSQRVCDINTPEDWQQAERMYAALRENAHAVS